MITLEQCRAARGLLGWSAQELAEQGGFGVVTVRRFEGGQAVNAKSIERIVSTLVAAGITLIADGEPSSDGGEGVRLARPAGEG